MLVIFDCDGVLVDSEHLAAWVFAQTLAAAGIDYTAERCLSEFRGLTLVACMARLHDTYPGVLAQDFLVELERATLSAFEKSLQPVPGVVPVIERLESLDRPLCVASNGGYRKLCHSLEVTGLWPHFDGRCFSAEWVAQGKPAPDLFQLAAESMGVPPHFCTVVEDSPTGVKAALAAGMRVVQHVAQTEPFGQGVPTFVDMQQLPELLSLPG